MITTIFSKCLSGISELLFPSYCYICHTENEHVCSNCLKRLRRAIDTPAPYITSIYSFKDPHLKKIIHAIKYFHRKDLISPFAKILSEEIQKEKDYTSYIVVPIPMPLLRKYVRGYNHTEALAQEICKKTSLVYENTILIRNPLKSTTRQVRARSRKERVHNQHNAFTLTASVEGMNIMLLDDVTTTGATLREARHLLLEHGASHVIAYTIAH